MKKVQYLKRQSIPGCGPRGMTVRQWIRRMKTINQYIELLETGKKFTEAQLIKEDINPNIPNTWKTHFVMG